MSALELNATAVVDTGAETADTSWKSLYRLGGAAALIAVTVYLLDVIITFLPGGAPEPGTLTVTDWFALLQGNWFLGLRALGFLNTIAMPLLLPMFLALFAAHRRVNQAYAALALILFVVGMAVYIASNPAVPMSALSGRYAAATAEAQRSGLVAAGEAILARGEDFTPGSLAGFLIGEIASLTMAVVMLRGQVFTKAAAYAGILGCVGLSIFTIWSTFVSLFYGAAVVLAGVGGLLNLVWLTLTARRLFRLGQ
ncbi:MAG TPA: hypothetical protein VGL40_13355 [Bacillota bacterium]|jgi:hypothetical protein